MVSRFLALLTFLYAGNAFAASGVPKFIDFYSMVLHKLHLGHEWLPTVGSVLITFVVICAGEACK